MQKDKRREGVKDLKQSCKQPQKNNKDCYLKDTKKYMTEEEKVVTYVLNIPERYRLCLLCTIRQKISLL